MYDFGYDDFYGIEGGTQSKIKIIEKTKNGYKVIDPFTEKVVKEVDYTKYNVTIPTINIIQMATDKIVYTDTNWEYFREAAIEIDKNWTANEPYKIELGFNSGKNGIVVGHSYFGIVK